MKEGTDITFMDALFTATSAVCVTGLTVVNTGLVFTLFGKIVVLCLIQIGGLGFMTMASLIFMAVGKRISLRERLILQESFNSDSLQGMVKLVRRAVLVTFTVEGAAAFILCPAADAGIRVCRRAFPFHFPFHFRFLQRGL